MFKFWDLFVVYNVCSVYENWSHEKFMSKKGEDTNAAFLFYVKTFFCLENVSIYINS